MPRTARDFLDRAEENAAVDVPRCVGGERRLKCFEPKTEEYYAQRLEDWDK
jgi:hypothetical protein